MAINISNAKNRDAVVAAETVTPKRQVRFVEAKGKPVSTVKLLKTDVTHELPELVKKQKKLEKVADALIKADPEIDIEHFGMFLTDTSRVYVDKERNNSSRRGIRGRYKPRRDAPRPSPAKEDRRRTMNCGVSAAMDGKVHQKRGSGHANSSLPTKNSSFISTG